MIDKTVPPLECGHALRDSAGHMPSSSEPAAEAGYTGEAEAGYTREAEAGYTGEAEAEHTGEDRLGA